MPKTPSPLETPPTTGHPVHESDWCAEFPLEMNLASQSRLPFANRMSTESFCLETTETRYFNPSGEVTSVGTLRSVHSMNGKERNCTSFSDGIEFVHGFLQLFRTSSSDVDYVNRSAPAVYLSPH